MPDLLRIDFERLYLAHTELGMDEDEAFELAFQQALLLDAKRTDQYFAVHILKTVDYIDRIRV
jgi:hypothetical protein